MKFVKNVTTKNYTLTGEINTPNGRDTINVNIISGGLYELDTHMNYLNLDKAIKEGSLIPMGEDVINDVPEVAVPDNSAEEDIEDTQNLTEEEENPEDSKVEDEPETPAEDTTPDVAESTDPSKFVCPHCGAEYATERGLAKHVEKVHNPEQ